MILAAVAAVVVLGLAGLAPRSAVRVITLVWPHGHPRRAELRAEIDAVPSWDRPLWVAGLLETAIVDGLPARLRRRPRPARAARTPRARARSPRAVWVVAGLLIVLEYASGRAAEAQS